MNRQFTIFLFSIFLYTTAFSQTRFSLCNDLGIQRSFKKEQQYWAVGHTVQGNFNFSPKNAFYVWISYYSDGKFSNDLLATAKSAVTVPQQINYVNSAQMRFKHFSVGWKKYLKGTFNEEINWTLYAYSGLGLLLGRVINTHSVVIDTTIYNVPVYSGKANFKRLTLDLGLGGEIPIGADFYFYTEGRVWVPTTDYPSNYLFVNRNAPVVGMLNVGIRILF